MLYSILLYSMYFLNSEFKELVKKWENMNEVECNNFNDKWIHTHTHTLT